MQWFYSEIDKRRIGLDTGLELPKQQSYFPSDARPCIVVDRLRRRHELRIPAACMEKY